MSLTMTENSSQRAVASVEAAHHHTNLFDGVALSAAGAGDYIANLDGTITHSDQTYNSLGTKALHREMGAGQQGARIPCNRRTTCRTATL